MEKWFTPVLSLIIYTLCSNITNERNFSSIHVACTRSDKPQTWTQWRHEEKTSTPLLYIIRNAQENTVASKQREATRLLAVLSVPPVAVITVRVTQRAAAPPSSNALIREQSHGKWSNDRGDRQPPWGCQASAGSAIAPRIHTCTNHHNLKVGWGRKRLLLFSWRLQIRYFCFTYVGMTVISNLMGDDKNGHHRGATRWRLPVWLYYFVNAWILFFFF